MCSYIYISFRGLISSGIGRVPSFTWVWLKSRICIHVLTNFVLQEIIGEMNNDDNNGVEEEIIRRP